MTITEAKQLCIVDYLASIGYHAQYVKAGQYWYRSPFRQEKTPSFKVNSRLNEWYDFGAATGGDLVELGKHLYQTNSVSEVLAHIEQHIKGTVIPHVRLPSPVTQPMEPEICNMIVVPLKNHALLSYLRTRLINTDVAKMFCAIHITKDASRPKIYLSSDTRMAKYNVMFAYSKVSWTFFPI